MPRRCFPGKGPAILVLALGAALAAGVLYPPEAGVIPPALARSRLFAQYDRDLNGYVLQVMAGYEGGRYPYLLNRDYAHYNGVTRDLYYRGRLLLRASPNGSRASHCVGITFEAFFRAVQARNRRLGLPIDYFNGLTWDELYDLALTWYAAKGDKASSNCAMAIERYGFGRRIHDPLAAEPGDFMDLTRADGSGHTVVFFGWLRSAGRIIGLRYWSSQASTRGIGYNAEYFRDNPPHLLRGSLLRAPIYIGRVGPVRSYRPPR
ncbi:MAG: hypothetical protein ACM3X6_01650 [Patescibacteria group bacterium]